MIVDKTAQLHRYNNDTSSAIGAEKKYKIVDDNAHIHIKEFKDNKLINVFILNYIDDNFIGYEEVINMIKIINSSAARVLPTISIIILLTG